MLRALQYKDKYFPIDQMHKSYGILKIPDIVQYKQSKIIHSLLTEDKKLPAVLKKLIVPTKNIHTHNTRHQRIIYEVKPRRPIGNRLLKCIATKIWNNLPQIVTQQNTHGEFKSEFYNFKIKSYKDSTLNFAPTMSAQGNVVVLLRPPYRTNVIALNSPAYAPFFCISAIFFRYLFYGTNLLYTNLFLYFHLPLFFPPQARRAQAYS